MMVYSQRQVLGAREFKFLSSPIQNNPLFTAFFPFLSWPLENIRLMQDIRSAANWTRSAQAWAALKTYALVVGGATAASLIHFLERDALTGKGPLRRKESVFNRLLSALLDNFHVGPSRTIYYGRHGTLGDWVDPAENMVILKWIQDAARSLERTREQDIPERVEEFAERKVPAFRIGVNLTRRVLGQLGVQAAADALRREEEEYERTIQRRERAEERARAIREGSVEFGAPARSSRGPRL
jgi:hypothetical protein